MLPARVLDRASAVKWGETRWPASRKLEKPSANAGLGHPRRCFVWVTRCLAGGDSAPETHTPHIPAAPPTRSHPRAQSATKTDRQLQEQGGMRTETRKPVGRRVGSRSWRCRRGGEQTGTDRWRRLRDGDPPGCRLRSRQLVHDHGPVHEQVRENGHDECRQREKRRNFGLVESTRVQSGHGGHDKQEHDVADAEDFVPRLDVVLDLPAFVNNFDDAGKKHQ